MTRSLIFLGTSNLDLVFYAPGLPVVGQSLCGRIAEFGGGKGANQAVAAARLGARPSFATLLGQDDAGDLLASMLEREGVRTDKIGRAPDGRTGRALIFVAADGSNMIGIDPGVNDQFGEADVIRALDGIPEDAVMVVEMGLPVAACRAAMARKGGRFLIFNPAPVRAQLTGVDCAAIDILTPNGTEAEELTGLKVETVEQAMTAAHAMRIRGVKAVAITLGRQGAVYVDATQQIHQPALPVRAVDTTAAGDAFNGGLATAIARGMPIDGALRFAIAVASLSVTREGAQQSMPSESQVQAFLMENGVA